MRGTRARSAARGHAAALLVTLLVALLASPQPAAAHGALRRSSPAADARLDRAPTELRLTFSERPELATTTIQLLDPDGRPVPLGAIELAGGDRRTVRAAITGALAAGRFTVAWKTIGADGHPVRGTFAFTILPEARGLAVPAPASPTPTIGAPADSTAQRLREPRAAEQTTNTIATASGEPAFGAESAPYAAVRWLQFSALLATIGAVAFGAIVLRRLPADGPAGELALTLPRPVARIGVVAADVLLVAALLRLLAQTAAFHGPDSMLDGDLVGPMLTRTAWGRAWLLQMVATVLAIAGFTLVLRRTPRQGWAVAAPAVLALAATPALAGHASAAPRLVPVAILADTLHVAGAGAWLGALLLLVAVGVPAALRLSTDRRGPAVAALVNAFSPVALVSASLVVATGLADAWLQLGGVEPLWQTGYGRLLLGKVAVVSLVGATGAYNWLRVRPALGDERGGRRIRRSATVELAIATLVLALTAILVATPTPASLQADAGQASDAAARSDSH